MYSIHSFWAAALSSVHAPHDLAIWSYLTSTCIQYLQSPVTADLWKRGEEDEEEEEEGEEEEEEESWGSGGGGRRRCQTEIMEFLTQSWFFFKSHVVIAQQASVPGMPGYFSHTHCS